MNDILISPQKKELPSVRKVETQSAVTSSEFTMTMSRLKNQRSKKILILIDAIIAIELIRFY